MLTSSVFQDKRVLFACNRPFDGPVQMIARECKSALGTDTVLRPLQRAVSSRARLPPSLSGSGIEMTMTQNAQSLPPNASSRRDTFDDESEETLSPVDLHDLMPPVGQNGRVPPAGLMLHTELQTMESGNRVTPPTNRHSEEPTPLENPKNGLPSPFADEPPEVNTEKTRPSEDAIPLTGLDRVLRANGSESQTSSIAQPGLSESVTIPFKTHEKRSMQHVILRDYVFCVGVILRL